MTLRIFISYSSKSKELVEAVAEDLETLGYQIWFDHNLTGGQAWWDQILDNIRQCDLFVFALTPEALDSQPCNREYGYAHRLGKNILPVLITDGVSVNLLPPELSIIQFVDYRARDRTGAFRLMNAINNLPPLVPLPDPLPEPPQVPISYIGGLKEQIDSPRSLTFEEQIALVFRLKERLSEQDDPTDVTMLLRRLKQRDDLFAKTEKEINSVLASITPSPATPPPASAREPVPAPTETPVLSPAQAPVSAPPQAHQSTASAPSVIVRPAAPAITARKLEDAELRFDFHSTPSTQPFQYEVPQHDLGSAVIVIIIITVVTCAAGFLMMARAIYSYNNGYIWLLVAALAQGILSGLYLRRLEPSPQDKVNPVWFVRTALMGGPLNGLLLRRVAPGISWWQVLIVAVIWIGGFIYSGTSIYYSVFRWGNFALDIGYMMVGTSVGIIGAIGTCGMLFWLRRAL